MEYDRDYQSAAHTRLPVPVISTHALLGIGGLLVWGFYLVTDNELAWATVAGLGVVAVLGLIMAARWVTVYRRYASPRSSPAPVVVMPPERHSPLPVIVIHGACAVTTVVQVVYATFLSGS